MPSSSNYSGHHTGKPAQQPLQPQLPSQPQQPIGRSQSAFNFLLNKAKAPFSSSTSSSNLNASTSMSSISAAQPQDPFDDTTNHVQYHRQLQKDHAFPNAPAVVSGPPRAPAMSSEKTSRSSTSDSQSMSRPAGPFSRPSYSDDPANPVASPTKRSFFGGIGRDRKASTSSYSNNGGNTNNNNSRLPPPQKPNFTNSPLSKSHRQEPSSSNYAQFSKSQSDLHARSDFPSPVHHNVELPRIPAIYQQNAPASADRNRFLRSPSPAMNFSRSVDDLSSLDQSSSPFASSPGHGESVSTLSTSATGTWGEQGVAAHGDWRPSDVGTIGSPAQQQQAAALHRFKAGHGKIDSISSQIQPSSSSSQAPPHNWSAMSPPHSSYLTSSNTSSTGKHARKVSKLGGKDFSARGAVATSLAATLGLTNAATSPGPSLSALNSSSASGTIASAPVPLPAGATFQGFISRNANISLSLAQLNEYEHGKGKDREKDITKGWKPYRVVLQDAKLYFYKPPSNISDEVKTLFPTTILRSLPPPSATPSTPGLAPTTIAITAESLARSGLSKNDLLLATSSASEVTSPLASPSLRPKLPGPRPSADRSTLASTDPLTPSAAAPSPPMLDAAQPPWAMPGKHPDLMLVEAIERPRTWAERVQSGTLDALAHEFVRATQSSSSAAALTTPLGPLSSPTSDEDEAESFALTLLASLSVRDKASGEDQTGAFLALVRKWAEADTSPDAAQDHSKRTLRMVKLCDVVLQMGLGSTYKEQLQSLLPFANLDQASLEKMLEVARLPPSIPNTASASRDWIATLADQPDSTREDLADLRKSLIMSDELLLRLEPEEIAEQIQAFHADRLSQLTCGSMVMSELLGRAVQSKSVDAFSFDSFAPHPVTKLALTHLLGDPLSPSEEATSGNVSQIGARHRASILRHWIAVASYSLTLGDIAGWVAISAALCSRAVIRLEQTWRILAEGDRVLVARESAPILSSISWLEGVAASVRPRFLADGRNAFVKNQQGDEVAAIPFLGNAFCRLLSAPPDHVDANQIRIAAYVDDAACLAKTVSEWQSAWLLNEQARQAPILLASHATPIPEYQATLELLFQDRGESKVAASFFMERSLKLEPKALGNHDAREHVPVPAGLSPSLPLIPLLFPHPLPLLSLLNSSRVVDEVFPKMTHASSRDPEATITSRSISRPALNGSPLLRSSAFSPPLGNKGIRNTAFSGVAEWNGAAAQSVDDASSTLFVGNELVLRIVQEPSLSLPNTPMTSKRFSQDFGRSTRPLSQISKRSSLPASNRSSVVDIVVPVQVSVRSATLDRMIDLLVMGVQHINVNTAQPTAETSDSPGAPARKTKLNMDMDAYRTTFLATFRSLCSPSALFEQLRKRFAAAVNASKELAGAEAFQTSSQFPSWISLTPVGSNAEPTDWDMVFRIRMGVILTLKLWVDRFPQDFVDDDVLCHLVLSFLRQSAIDATAEDPDRQKLIHALGQLRGMFVTSIMGPNVKQEERSYVNNASVQVSQVEDHGEFDFDRAEAADLVEYLESTATVFFDKIVERDLLVVSEMFEKQASRPTAWFGSKHGGQRSDEGEKLTNSMYTLLEGLKAPGSTADDATLEQKFPVAVRDALAAQSLFKGWIVLHVIEAGIGLEKRQQRILKLIDALWICRARMAKLRIEDSGILASPSPGTGPVTDPALPFREATIGSFIESAIISSLGSSESRIFLRAWQGAAVARSGRGDGLADLYPKEVSASMRSASELSSTPDIGWILACLAEATTRTSSIKTVTDVELVDFDKRRTIWTLIEGSVRIRPACTMPGLIELAGARLKLMQNALNKASWNRQVCREDALNEMRNAPPIRADASLRQSSSSKALSGVSKQQQDKLRRDRAASDLLDTMGSGPAIGSRMSSMSGSRSQPLLTTAQSTGTPQHQSQSQSQSVAANPTATPQTVPAPPDKATVRARRMTALFKGAVRPLMSADKHDAPAKSVHDLMRLTPLQKPSIIAGLGGAQVAVWNNHQRSFVFHLTSEEGVKYLLQAPNGTELSEWMSRIEQISKERAKSVPNDLRRTGAVAKPKSGAVPIYGRPLSEVVEREGRAVPMAIERMFAEIEARGLREQGIYRVSGSKNSVEALRRAWDELPSDAIDLSTGEFSDIHTITGAIKAWFRELPEPVVTFDSYDALIETNAMENDDRLYAMRDIIWNMPKCHFDMLRRTAEHLARVVEEGEHNKMLAHNVALVFGTSLLNPPPGPSSVVVGFGNLGKAANIVKTIVTMHEWLFEPEPEPEADAEAEAEPEPVADGEGEIVSQPDAETTRLQMGSSPPASIVDVSAPASFDQGAASSSTDSAVQKGSSTHEHVIDEENETEQVPELMEAPRKVGRTRPLTIVGFDSLGGGASMLRSASTDSEGGTPIDGPSSIPEITFETPRKMASATEHYSSGSPRAETTPKVMPTITLSKDMDSDEDESGDDVGPGDEINEIDATLSKLMGDQARDRAMPRRTDQEEEEAVVGVEGDAAHDSGMLREPSDEASAATKANRHASVALASALGQPLRRPKQARSGYRDSVFSSYSIYADCLDNMNLESQSSAASMMKRRSGLLLNAKDAEAAMSAAAAAAAQAQTTDK